MEQRQRRFVLAGVLAHFRKSPDYLEISDLTLEYFNEREESNFLPKKEEIIKEVQRRFLAIKLAKNLIRMHNISCVRPWGAGYVNVSVKDTISMWANAVHGGGLPTVWVPPWAAAKNFLSVWKERNR